MRLFGKTAALAALLALAVGCSSSGDDDDSVGSLVVPDENAPCGALPEGGVYATFEIAGDETIYLFRSSITGESAIADAIALWEGTSTATIPTAPLLCEPAPWNCEWSFQQVPDMVEFADFTTEVCDATPAFVAGDCEGFGAGRYCPWSAVLVRLQDCRTDPSCPLVPR